MTSGHTIGVGCRAVRSERERARGAASESASAAREWSLVFTYVKVLHDMTCNQIISRSFPLHHSSNNAHTPFDLHRSECGYRLCARPADESTAVATWHGATCSWSRIL